MSGAAPDRGGPRRRAGLVTGLGFGQHLQLVHGGDTYSKVAFAKLYQEKTPVTAADLLNDRVLPFFQAAGVAVLIV